MAAWLRAFSFHRRQVLVPSGNFFCLFLFLLLLRASLDFVQVKRTPKDICSMLKLNCFFSSSISFSFPFH